MEKNREIWLDWLRVVACFLVMLTHSTEPFYLGGEGSLILTHSDAVWAAVMDVFSRAAMVQGDNKRTKRPEDRFVLL